MPIYPKNNCAKFHPDRMWNDEALGFSEEHPQQQKQQQEEDE